VPYPGEGHPELGSFDSPRKTRLSITSPPLMTIFSCTLSGSAYFPRVKYVGTGTTIHKVSSKSFTAFPEGSANHHSHFSPFTSFPSLPSLNKSPTMTEASNGPCFPLMAVIFETRRGRADRGEPIARLRRTGGEVSTLGRGETEGELVSDLLVTLRGNRTS